MVGSISKLAVAPLLLAVAACGGVSEQRVTEGLLFAGRKLPEVAAARREVSCPAVSLVDGTASHRSGGPQARGVGYQITITDYARECADDGITQRIKVGVQGRVLLGDEGKPGTFTVPVRIAVRGNGQTLSSKLVSASVTIPPNDTQAAFVIVDENVSVPITAEDPGEQYTILVGLDPKGKAAPAPKRRRR